VFWSNSIVKEKVSLLADKRTWKPAPLVGQIVFVTTLNEDGQSNIAPKSWISMMAFEPSLLAVGCNFNHWTAKNILRSKEFVVNVPGDDLASVVWQSHTIPHPRPVERVGLTPVPATTVKPPLVEECRAHLECQLAHFLTFGDEIIIFGQIVACSVDRQALEADDPYAYLRPLVFLENGLFGVVEKAQPVPRDGS
jgi:flavin reductase (DIM6/NTAB) family NADH-FMN oxidoreductase RutF